MRDAAVDFDARKNPSAQRSQNELLARLVSALSILVGHGAGWAPPPGQNAPPGQWRQRGSPDASEASPYVPGTQAGGSSSELPRGHRDPAIHGLQADAPGSFWYVEAGQSVHAALRSAGAWLPGVHAVGAVAPVVHM